MLVSGRVISLVPTPSPRIKLPDYPLAMLNTDCFAPSGRDPPMLRGLSVGGGDFWNDGNSCLFDGPQIHQVGGDDLKPCEKPMGTFVMMMMIQSAPIGCKYFLAINFGSD